MEGKEKLAGSLERILWHPAFAQAIRLELEPYKNVLEFHDEVQLTSEPLKADMVIIRKAAGAVIDKNIARIFKGFNLVEYKSPEDYASVYDFYKVLGYAVLYASFSKHDLRDMTVTIVESRHPRKLFKYIGEDKRCAVEEVWPGIYWITGFWIPIQVIESKKLPAEENLWLKGLDRGLNRETAGSILKESGKKDAQDIAAYLDTVLKANPETVREVLKMDKTGALTLDKVLEEAGLTAKWEARGEARGVAIGEKTAWEKFVALMEQGYTAEELKRMTPSGVSPSAQRSKR